MGSAGSTSHAFLKTPCFQLSILPNIGMCNASSISLDVLDVRVRAEQPSSMQQCSKYEHEHRNHMQACLAHSLCHTAQNLCTGAIRGISYRVSTDQGLLSPHSVLSFCLYIYREKGGRTISSALLVPISEDLELVLELHGRSEKGTAGKRIRESVTKLG